MNERNIDLMIARHGNDDDGEINHIDGLDGTEPKLSKEGIRQSILLANIAMKNFSLQKPIDIFASPTDRTIQTAILLATGLEINGYSCTIISETNLSHPHYSKIENPDSLPHDEKVRGFRLAWRAFDEALKW